MQVCKRLPAVSVSWQASWRAAAGGLPAEEPRYELEVQLRVRGRRSHLARVYAPRFPKARAVLQAQQDYSSDAFLGTEPVSCHSLP